MHNPPHPGEFIIQVYLEPNNLSGRELAAKLGVAASTLNRILTGASRISPEMALRFILSNPDVSTTIPGMRKLKNVEANMQVSDGKGLPEQLLKELNNHRWDREPTEWSQ